MQVGVDEAGKGPVVGSMFAAAVGVSDPAMLSAAITDSKQVSADDRSYLVNALRDNPDVYIAVSEVSVEVIDDPQHDMGELTVQAHQQALQRLDAVLPAGTYSVLLDGADVDADRFAANVAAESPQRARVQAEHQADETNRVVGAASLVAKAAREEHITALEQEYDRAIGSGYPGDSTTRSFLQAVVRDTGSLPPCARTSWQTSRDILSEVEQRGLDDFL